MLTFFVFCEVHNKCLHNHHNFQILWDLFFTFEKSKKVLIQPLYFLFVFFDQSEISTSIASNEAAIIIRSSFPSNSILSVCLRALFY
jgi:hypothetical protein